ncbi:MAG: Crp/Fnr family transcriptional regulator [Alphaproteobacteria bacterium]|nr:Crp/Fnr family transcriptional regulator [Alphaproteobacteria bacterium]
MATDHLLVTPVVHNGVALLARKLRARDSISPEEEQVLRDAVVEVREVRAGKVLVRQGTPVNESTLLIEGIVCRYKDLASGERQIQELHVPGDFVDLHGFLLKRLDHNIASVSRALIALVPHDRLRRITEEHPHLSRMLWFSTMLDASVQRETILSVGRRTAFARIAHLMCELCLRLQVVGLSEDGRFAMPITQTDLADATGLTSVHVNRMLKQLRDQDMLTFRNGMAEIHDWERLARAAEFDPAYLHLDRQPR